MYSQKIIKRFQKPKFSGEIKKADAVGEVGNMKCGDVIKVYLKIEKGVIKDVKFKTYGCIAAIASSDMLCELVKGKTLDEALKVMPQDIVNELGDMPPIKYHCSLLGTQALKKAIEDYKKKEKK